MFPTSDINNTFRYSIILLKVTITHYMNSEHYTAVDTVNLEVRNSPGM